MPLDAVTEDRYHPRTWIRLENYRCGSDAFSFAPSGRAFLSLIFRHSRTRVAVESSFDHLWNQGTADETQLTNF